MVICALVVAPVAQNQPGTTKVQPALAPPPYWAYAADPPTATSHADAKPVNDTPQRVAGSEAAFTRAQIGDLFNTPDWHPAEHPAMPEVVAHGREPNVYACGYCHLPNGQGRPENSSLAGLPANYIIQQMADFRSGRRKRTDPGLPPIALMIGVATSADEKQIQAAAAYFSGLKPKPWIRVVETSTVPKTHVAGRMLVVSEPVVMEPIGQRIIETPENLERTELRDDASGFIAYVPVGSIKKGKALVTTGGAGKTMQCAACHGPDLKGLGNVPSIAGRSPSYIVRQLYDIQIGARAGAATQAMKATVERLTVDTPAQSAGFRDSSCPYSSRAAECESAVFRLRTGKSDPRPPVIHLLHSLTENDDLGDCRALATAQTVDPNRWIWRSLGTTLPSTVFENCR
jgi:cytochrome c553